MDEHFLALAREFGPLVALVLVVSVGRLKSVSNAIGRLADAWIEAIRVRSDAVRARTERDRTEAALNVAVLRRSHDEGKSDEVLPRSEHARDLGRRRSDTPGRR